MPISLRAREQLTVCMLTTRRRFTMQMRLFELEDNSTEAEASTECPLCTYGFILPEETMVSNHTGLHHKYKTASHTQDCITHTRLHHTHKSAWYLTGEASKRQRPRVEYG